MINPIGVMQAMVRAKKRPDEQINFQVEVKKRRRKPEQEDESPRRKRAERGVSA